MKLESWHSAEDKARFKVVRTDSYTDLPGEIVAADEDTGDCSMQEKGVAKTYTLGLGGIRIVARGR